MRLGERLLRAKLITPEAIQRALEHQALTGHRFGDSLVALGLLSEHTMLRFLAEQLGTLFVSAEKLSRASISKKALEQVPVRFAEEYGIVPVALDETQRRLTVVCEEPQNTDALKELALLSDMREITAYVALRSTVRAAIRQHYFGDVHAFEEDLAETEAVRGDLSAIVRAYEESNEVAVPPTVVNELSVETPPRPPRPQATEEPGGPRKEHDLAEMLNVLVGMLELPSLERRGHSATVSRLSTQLGQELELSPQELAFLAVAAQLHDLGKPRNPHLTLFSLFSQAPFRELARTHLEAPLRLFEKVRLPEPVSRLLTQLYEAWDGTGLPAGLRQTEILPGARILALVDSFVDLTQNPNNVLGKRLSIAAALGTLKAQAGRLFDPEVFRLLEHSRRGESLRRRLRQDGRQILVASPEQTLRQELNDALNARDWPTHSLARLDGVAQAVFQGEADALLLDLSFGAPELTTLLKSVRGSPDCAGLPVTVLGVPGDLSLKERLESAQATLLPMPQKPDEIARHMDGTLAEAAALGAPGRVVQGSFDEMPLPELLQLLGELRKSGKLWLEAPGMEATLLLEEGQALWAHVDGRQGAEAMKFLAASTFRSFRFDPESLLMELPQMAVALERWQAG